MYTELRKGNKKAVEVVRNNTAYSKTLQKKTPVARAVAASPVPETPEGEQLLGGLMSPMIPIPIGRQLGKDMVNYLMSWT